MMATQLVLERFDPRPSAESASASDTADGLHTLRSFDMRDPAKPGSEPPAEGEDDLADEPSRSDIDWLATEEARSAELLEGIRDALIGIAEDQNSLRHKTGLQAAAYVSQASAKLLPSIARTTFLAELSNAIVQLATALDGTALQLRVNPDQAEQLMDALREHSRDLSLDLLATSEQAPGTAALFWVGGGADFDCDNLVQILLQDLETQLQGSILEGLRDD